MRLALLAILCLLPACEAKAPPTKEQAYVLREAYVRDTRGIGKPFDIKDCNVSYGFRKANPAPMEGYTHVLMCLPIGNL